jgi:hypothetical protein
MIVEYTRNEYSNLHGISPYVILLDVIPTPMTFDDCGGVCVRQDV